MMNMMKTLLLSLAIVTTATFSVSASAASAEDAAVEEVIKHVVAFNAAYERNELDAYFAYYAADATLWFDSGLSSWRTIRRTGTNSLQMAAVS